MDLGLEVCQITRRSVEQLDWVTVRQVRSGQAQRDDIPRLQTSLTTNHHHHNHNNNSNHDGHNDSNHDSNHVSQHSWLSSDGWASHSINNNHNTQSNQRSSEN